MGPAWRSRGQWPPLEGTESRFPRGRGSKARRVSRRGCDPGEGTGWVKTHDVVRLGEGTAGDTVLLELRVRLSRGGKLIKKNKSAHTYDQLTLCQTLFIC